MAGLRTRPPVEVSVVKDGEILVREIGDDMFQRDTDARQLLYDMKAQAVVYPWYGRFAFRSASSGLRYFDTREAAEMFALAKFG